MDAPSRVMSGITEGVLGLGDLGANLALFGADKTAELFGGNLDYRTNLAGGFRDKEIENAKEGQLIRRGMRRNSALNTTFETKEAPPGTYFTKSGNLVKGRLTKDAKERGARETDPLDDTRSKVPKVTQYRENFADGKKKGRKGLSKRVGVSQKMSIAQLEKIAKNSTGERRRMAQWNLNMKRGRKK